MHRFLRHSSVNERDENNWKNVTHAHGYVFIFIYFFRLLPFPPCKGTFVKTIRRSPLYNSTPNTMTSHYPCSQQSLETSRRNMQRTTAVPGEIVRADERRELYGYTHAYFHNIFTAELIMLSLLIIRRDWSDYVRAVERYYRDTDVWLMDWVLSYSTHHLRSTTIICTTVL